MRQLKAEYYKMKYSRASKWVLVFMAFIFFIPFVVGNDTLFMTFGDYRNIDSIAFYKEGIKRGFMYQGVKPSNYGVCGAISLNSFVIGPDGALYKCWNDIGYSERSIGNLEKGIKLTNKFVEWLSYDVVKDQECKDCSFFPVCYGGCAAYKNKICSSVKWNAEEMLELMKEMAQ